MEWKWHGPLGTAYRHHEHLKVRTMSLNAVKSLTGKMALTGSVCMCTHVCEFSYLPEDLWFQVLHFFTCNIRWITHKEVTAWCQLTR